MTTWNSKIASHDMKTGGIYFFSICSSRLFAMRTNRRPVPIIPRFSRCEFVILYLIIPQNALTDRFWGCNLKLLFHLTQLSCTDQSSIHVALGDIADVLFHHSWSIPLQNHYTFSYLFSVLDSTDHILMLLYQMITPSRWSNSWRTICAVHPENFCRCFFQLLSRYSTSMFW